jgi:HK97 gp10 family phage protein
MDVKVDASGWGGFRGVAAELKGALKGGLTKGQRDLAEQTAADMRALVPHDTGRLADTIRIEQDRPNEIAVVVGVEGETDYLGYVEWGTIYMPAQPFVRSSADVAGGRLEAKMTDEARNSLSRSARGAREL